MSAGPRGVGRWTCWALRLAGAEAVSVIVQVPALDEVVLLSLSHGRGIHLSDAFGVVIVVAGIGVMWRGG